MSDKKLTIYAPDIHKEDAVGNHCIGIAKLANRLGYSVKIYAKNYTCDDPKIVINTQDDFLEQVEPDELIFLSYSIYDPFLEYISSLPNKKICYFHDITPPELLKEYDPLTASLCEKAFHQMPLLHDFDCFVSNSKQSSLLLKSSGVDKPISIIPPVFRDFSIFNRRSERKQGKKSDILNLLSVGRVVPHKCIEDIISILAQLPDVYSGKYRLKIVGSIPNQGYFKYLINYAKKEGVLQYISFCGMLSQNDLNELFDHSQVLISMSKHEGFCIPVLEAMYSGLPVILKVGTAADEFAKKVAFNVSHSNEAVNTIISILDNNDISLSKSIAQAEFILDQTDDSRWAQIFNNIH